MKVFPVRPLTPEDAPQVVALWHQGWHDAHDALLPAEFLPARGEGFFADRLGAWTGTVLGASVDGDLAAVALVKGTELHQIVVAPRLRGTGLAQRMLSAVEERIVGTGGMECTLLCALGNDRGLRFFERAGFGRTGAKDFTLEGGAGIAPVTRPVVLMRKWLGDGPEVRPATEADRARILEIWHSAWHDAHGLILPEDVVAERTPDIFSKRLQRLLQDSYVAVENGEIAAFAAIQGDEIDQFYVDTKFRGTGLAKLFLSVLEGVLARRGVKQAAVQCAKGNVRAQRFYARCDWIDTGIFDLPVYTADGRHAAHPTHLFKKTLR